MSTLAVVEEILRETGVPMSVREIVERAGVRLPSKSKTPDTVVARDLSMDLKKRGEASLFARTSPGRYTLRSLASLSPSATTTTAAAVVPPSPSHVSPLASLPAARKPPLAASPSPSSSAAPTTRARTENDVGNGFAS